MHKEAKDLVEDSVVLVGRKPTMNYVLATTLPLAEGRKVILKARGKAIAKAVDVVEVVRRRFVQNAVIEKINIGTEEGRVGNDGRQRNVSTIEIILSQPKPSKK
ncbi:MAG: DNA-binding protein Alba [Candidatus Caldarchaeum sp.]|nr:DNA-binding protein Alba [Candidatus Caldarchaeum sp.]MCX8200532.1 DNA-binding protein Alba [Candidatus Caldarchaeum sp.]MDW8063186.1 DNA-binding protein Alba [Candidatus Caldarchaeum sp.]MDW8434989.1 DNA-binding protein Alba [Candidatus Caldarchaeum sp.]